MRGKGSIESIIERRIRITPAYAGKRLNNEKISNRERDHPRLCGEKRFAAGVLMPACGSPPPMRGKGFAAGVLMPACGITPAYAGKRSNKEIL